MVPYPKFRENGEMITWRLMQRFHCPTGNEVHEHCLLAAEKQEKQTNRGS